MTRSMTANQFAHYQAEGYKFGVWAKEDDEQYQEALIDGLETSSPVGLNISDAFVRGFYHGYYGLELTECWTVAGTDCATFDDAAEILNERNAQLNEILAENLDGDFENGDVRYSFNFNGRTWVGIDPSLRYNIYQVG